MGSFDNMVVGCEAWDNFRSSSWISEAFARDTEILTKALQNSIVNNNNDNNYKSCDFVKIPETTSSQHQTQSFTSSGGGGGGSETESVSKHVTTFRNAVVKGKVSKRKSRASKRALTTFIAADPENFRQMVQEVTGIRFSGGPGRVGPVLKPEPQKRVQNGWVLPTLDTSAFLLDHHQEDQQVVGPSCVDFGLPEVSGPGLDFSGFAGFPTLESWN